MTGYLTDMAAWLRATDRLAVVEYDGWQTRANNSGGFGSGRPWGVMWHHDASSPTSRIQDVLAYEARNASTAPICNVHVDRDATVYVLAAGRTNTNGKGNPVRWSRGTVPADSMNSYAVGMEISNSGVGEPYPRAQIDAAFLVSNTLNAHLGNQPSDVCTHYGYAPTRKIDPARAEGVQGPWVPRSCSSSGTWDLADLIAECNARAAGAPPAPTPLEDDAVLYVEVSDAWARFVATGQADPLVLWQVGYTTGERADVHAANLRHVSVTKAQLSGCSLVGEPPPADDGGGPARWDPTADFYEWIT